MSREQKFSKSVTAYKRSFVKLISIIFQTSVRTSQETHYVFATTTSRLMLFRETVAVHRENHTEHTNNIYKFSSYLTGNTLRLRYKDQPVNAV
jgi:hypothetical protein